jgi:hypothetical protein
VRGLPADLDGVPVDAEVTGTFYALAVDPTQKARPAPLGFSVGHPSITAGTIGFRVLDRTGSSPNVYILSNNHVLANSNNASIGNATLQPGPYDGGTSADQIGTLHDFQVITFGSTGNNVMDAAIARVTNAGDLLASSPAAPDAYGQPNAKIWGDANNDNVFDNVGALLNVKVQKFGRTTGWTKGTITGVNATVTVCYAGMVICTKSARFTDQLIVGQSGFSAGGDSGSGIVTDDSNKYPVGLLFAGSSAQTILNRIDLVLNRFSAKVDGGSGDPPPPTGTGTHVGTLTSSTTKSGNSWSATVTIAVHDANHALLAGAAVTGTWSGGISGNASCTTAPNGTCNVSAANIHNRNGSVIFTVTGAGSSYNSADNHVTSITVNKP